MTELGNEQMATDNLAEIKTLVTDIKENMMSEKNCNDQLYTIIQTLDGIGNYIERLEGGETPKTEEYTVLQTNILEVRNELARLNQSIDATNLLEFEPLVTKLADKVNRLDIIANNSGIDKQVLMNVASQLELNLSNKMNENSEVLYNQTNTSANMIKTDMETLNANLKDGIEYLEKVVAKSAEKSDNAGVQTLSDDIALLSTKLEKSNDNLKRSIIDIFSKLQENLGSTASLGGSPETANAGSLLESLEMLKNGLYNVNLNSTKQYKKMVQLVSEMETYKNLERFASLKSIPEVGLLKETLYGNLSNLVTNFTETVDMTDPTTLVEQLTEGIYKELSSFLTNISEFVDDYEERQEKSLNDKLDELLPFTRESAKDIKDLLCDLKKNLSCMQSGDEESDYTYSMQDVESDIAKIRIYLNEVGKQVNLLAQKDVTEDVNNIFINLDSINQKVSTNENFKITDNVQKMQEDILSISTRVNTLLLSSEKDSETLKESLDEFNKTFQEINNELQSEDRLRQFEVIEEALARIDRTLQENKSYNELINQSLVMLAEWVDNAGESITSISDKLGNGIEAINIPTPIDYSSQIDALEMRIAEQNSKIAEQNELIAQQQQYISVVNQKLDVLMNQSQQIALQEERLRAIDEKMTTVLEFSAKNDASLVMDKMSNIDAKLEKLNYSIGRLTSYVDEE